MTRAEALHRLRARLQAAGIHPADQEADWLLAHVLGSTPASVWAHRAEALQPGEESALEALTRRRERREPLQLILGEMPFHGVTLQAEPGVFIPRPETEELVEAVLDALTAKKGPGSGGREDEGGRASDSPRSFGVGANAGNLPSLRNSLGPPRPLAPLIPAPCLVDLGTGTGAIAIALLHALPEWRGVAVDRSPLAVALTARNAHRNGVGERLRAVVGDFTATAPAPWEAEGPFDLVVSNPPYIRRGDIPGLMPEVRDHDPVLALDGGADGLDALRHLATRLPVWLRPGGLLALEIGADQADTVLGLLSPTIQDARVLPDRAGLPRIVIGTQRGGDA